jgi:hypothetical protein
MNICIHAIIYIDAYMQRYIYTCTHACICWYMHEIHTYIYMRMHTSPHTHDHNLHWQQNSISNPLPWASLSSTNPEPAALIEKTSKLRKYSTGRTFCGNWNAWCKGGNLCTCMPCGLTKTADNIVLGWHRANQACHECMDVCMYVCVYVCIYACMYVSMHACMYACVCVYACMHACM